MPDILLPMVGTSLALPDLNLHPWLDRLKFPLYAPSPLFSSLHQALQNSRNASGFSALSLASRTTDSLHALLSPLLSSVLYLYAKPSLSIIVILLLTLVFALYMYRTHTPVPPNYLAALSMALIPTTSRWPTYYTSRMRAALIASRPLFSVTPSSAKGSMCEVVLELDMDTLLSDIAAGRVELRTPDSSLETLMAGRDLECPVHEEDGDTLLRIRLVTSLSTRVAVWWADIIGRAPPITPDQSYTLIDHTSTQALLDLDKIPVSHIPTLLSRFAPKTRAVLLLSSAASPSALNASQPSPQSLSALRAYPFTSPRTPASLRTQLPELLRILHKAGAVLEKVEDAGAAYADALVSAANTLEWKSGARSAFVAQRSDPKVGDGDGDDGLKAWRTEVLSGRWEAALVRAGTVRKWAVTVRT